jgi:hypothetical protein
MAACEKRCAECPDKPACLSQGGECAAGTYFNDTGDIGPDIWTPGCHYQYWDPQCSTGKAFVDGDICSEENPKLIIEWTLSDCHPPQGDTATYNCDVECLRAGRGNGTCVPLPTACSGKRSAYCKCDRPGPTG